MSVLTDGFPDPYDKVGTFNSKLGIRNIQRTSADFKILGLNELVLGWMRPIGFFSTKTCEGIFADRPNNASKRKRKRNLRELAGLLALIQALEL